jgi:hypothetical protein
MIKHTGKHLHIISFDIPYPPNYGGVIDVFYKIRSLAAAGVKIHLHAFQYGRHHAKILEELCESVNYYQRDVSKSQLFLRAPYIVVSRSSESLIHNLLKDDHPILFEGLHSTYFLGDHRLEDRKKIVRTHNIEHEYYKNLALAENNIFKRYYFYNESSKLETYESILSKATCIAAISPNDSEYFKNKYQHAVYIPAFHAHHHVNSHTGKGSYAFYHGNLAIGENDVAAQYLIQEVFKNTPATLLIAGSKPGVNLRNAVQRRSNVTLLSDLNTKQINNLLADAHVNVLPTFQPTGIKLKLLSALFNGRFALVNTPMIQNTGLESLCTIADSPESMREALNSLFKMEFTQMDITFRKEVLMENFDNRANALKLKSLIF